MRTKLVRRCATALAVLGAALVTSAGPEVVAAGVCPATVPAGSVRVVIVIDPGTEPGAPGGPAAACLVLAEGSTGSDLLRRRAEQLGAPAPRYAPSGLLCAIDGYPAPPECGAPTAAGYRYWSWWRGTAGRWEYGQGNPFTRRLRDGDIEGWRFVNGVGGPADPPPRLTPTPGSWFPAPPPPTTPPPVSVPAPGPGGGAGVPPPTPGDPAGGSGAPAASPGATPDPTGATAGSDPAPTPATPAHQSGEPAGAPGSAPTEALPAGTSVVAEPAAELAAAGGRSAAPTLPVAAGLVLIAGLVILAATRLRAGRT